MTDLSSFGGGVDQPESDVTNPTDAETSDPLGVECDVDGCDEQIVGLDDGWEYSRGTVCQSCIDYRNRHGHWPDEEQEPCVECEIDAGKVDHQCPESAFDGVILEPGSECEYCGAIAQKDDREMEAQTDD